MFLGENLIFISYLLVLINAHMYKKWVALKTRDYENYKTTANGPTIAITSCKQRLEMNFNNNSSQVK